MADAHPDHAHELSAQDARQARWGRPAFVVLILSTLLAALALLAAGIGRMGFRSN